MTQGRKPDLARRQQALDLWGQGLPLNQIARKLGISRYSVYYILHTALIAHPLLCRHCNAVIAEIGQSLDNMQQRPLCRGCLKSMPEASFAERLRSLRLARGLSRAQLARVAKVCPQTIYQYEYEKSARPHRATLQKLIQFLGPELLPSLEGRERGS